MIRTVRGKIDGENLGPTLIHEHIYVKPNELFDYYDYTLDNTDKMIEELDFFKKSNGRSIVDLTPINYGRNPIALFNIAKKTSVNLMFVTGFHKEEFMPKWLDKMTDDDIYIFLKREILEGVTEKNLLPVAMKFGTSNNKITAKEKRIIEIEAKVHRDTKIPFITHCGKGTMGIQQIQLLEKFGVDLKKVCLSHVDLTMDYAYILEIVKTGASISFDHVGRDPLYEDFNKIKILSKLIQAGYIDKINISGDMGRKKYLKAYKGKPGLDYILTDFRENFIKEIDEKSFDKILIENPKRFLEW